MASYPIVDAAFLDQQLAELEKAQSWSPRTISKLETLINSDDPWVPYRVNPIKFAKDRNLSEDEAIALFLHATKLQLFEMEWRLLCPQCGESIGSFAALAKLQANCYCRMCRLATEAALDDFIAVSFTLSARVRDLPFNHPEALSAADVVCRLHLDAEGHFAGYEVPFSQLVRQTSVVIDYIEPGETRVIDFAPPAGMLCGFSFSNGQGFANMVDSAAGRTNELAVTISDDGWQAPSDAVKPGATRVTVKCTATRRMLLHLYVIPAEHPEGGLVFPPFLTGSRLLNNQTFRTLFRNETVASSEGLGVRDLAILFTDLKGSTEMYDRIGDLKAFSLVQQHFEHLGRVIQSERGAVVKTIGDAVMASFDTPEAAVRAALGMLKEIDDFNRARGSEDIILKVGIHRGPSIAVTLNERLDYFGQTVNIAARVQGLAGAEELCLTDAVYGDPAVPPLLGSFNVNSERASLKGVTEAVTAYRVRPRAS